VLPIQRSLEGLQILIMSPALLCVAYGEKILDRPRFLPREGEDKKNYSLVTIDWRGAEFAINEAVAIPFLNLLFELMGLKGTIYHVLEMSDHNVCVDMGSRDAAFKVYNSSHTMRLIRVHKDQADPVGSMFFTKPQQLIEALFFQRGVSEGVPSPLAGLIQVSMVDHPGKAFWVTPRYFPPLNSSKVPHGSEPRPAGEDTDQEKTSIEGTSVPESLPAR
jgi:hypothetical protein